MFTVRIQARDFVDDTPVDGAAVAVRVSMTAVWKLGHWELRIPWLNTESKSLAPQPARSLGQGIYECAFDLSETYQELSSMRKDLKPPDSIRLTGSVSIAVAILDDSVALNPLSVANGSDLDTVMTQLVRVDFVKAIVGDTTPSSARLWFASNGRSGIPDDRCVCEIERLTPRRTIPKKPSLLQDLTLPDEEEEDFLHWRWSQPVSFHAGPNVANLEVKSLRPSTRYRYALRDRAAEGAGVPGSGRILATGEFTTAPVASQRLSLVFGSCHKPTKESLGRSQALADRRDYDLLLLMGDQIYEDEIEGMGDTWEERYWKQYHLLPRSEATKKIWDYIKKNKLQDAKKKTLINADDALKAVFGGKKQVTMFEMTKHVSGHLK